MCYQWQYLLFVVCGGISATLYMWYLYIYYIVSMGISTMYMWYLHIYYIVSMGISTLYMWYLHIYYIVSMGISTMYMWYLWEYLLLCTCGICGNICYFVHVVSAYLLLCTCGICGNICYFVHVVSAYLLLCTSCGICGISTTLYMWYLWAYLLLCTCGIYRHIYYLVHVVSVDIYYFVSYFKKQAWKYKTYYNRKYTSEVQNYLILFWTLFFGCNSRLFLCNESCSRTLYVTRALHTCYHFIATTCIYQDRYSSSFWSTILTVFGYSNGKLVEKSLNVQTGFVTIRAVE